MGVDTHNIDRGGSGYEDNNAPEAHPLPSSERLAAAQQTINDLFAWYKYQIGGGQTPKLPEGFTPQILQTLWSIKYPDNTSPRTLESLNENNSANEEARSNLKSELTKIVDPVASGVFAFANQAIAPDSLHPSIVDE